MRDPWRKTEICKKSPMTQTYWFFVVGIVSREITKMTPVREQKRPRIEA